MRFEYRLTLNEYKESNQAHSNQIYLKFGIACVGMCLLIKGLLLLLKTTVSIQELLLEVIQQGLVVGIISFPEFYMMHQVSMKLAWNNAPLIKDETVVEFNDEELTINTPLSKYTLKWAAYTHWKETLNLFLVYQSDNSSSIFPKRSFVNEEQIDRLRELLRSKLPDRS